MSLSGYYPTRESILNLVVNTAEQVQLAMQQKNIAVRHNAYTDYCLALIFCATGHRPIHDPIQSQKYFDLEQGWMLIADKILSEERAWRVVALPEVACEQLQYYADYLPRLTSWLAHLPGSQDLVMELNGLIGGKETQPYFFYLDESAPTKRQSITPRAILQRWEDRWKLPLNFLRHIAATELLHKSTRADWVQLQLGHIMGIDHPFGVTATESAKEVFAQISPHLNNFMDELGWNALRSPMRSPADDLSTKYGEKDESISPTQFSHGERTQKREKRRQLAAPIVKQALNAILGVSERLPTHDEFNQILQVTIENAYKKRLPVNHCLQLLYRYLRSIKGGVTLLKRVARIRELEHEPSPFNENSLIEYKATRRARQNFLDYLDSSGKSHTLLNKEQRIAEIIFSAALFGGIVDLIKLNNLSIALTKNTYQYNDKLFVDIPLKDTLPSPVFRWFPDSISMSLILGMYQSSSTVEPYNQEQIAQQLAKLSKILKLEGGLPGLANVALTGIIFEAPGHIASCLHGNTATVSLPLAQWIRIESNQALKLVERPKKIINTESSTWFYSTSLSNIKNAINRTRQFLNILRALFNEIENHPEKRNIERSKLQRKALKKTLKKRFPTSEACNWSPLILAIVSWTVHLCEDGTRNKKELAFSTVHKYTFMITRALSTIAPKENFLTLEDNDYDELYLRAIESMPEKGRFYLAGRLIEFHTFLMEAFSVDEPDWSSIFRVAAIRKEASYADANIISENEYIDIIRSVQADTTLNIQNKTQYTVLLILGYRFGLRSGEALRIRYRDVQMDTSAISILVRNSIFGETKSAAGVRTIPLLEQITDTELKALQRIMSYSEAHFYTDNQAPLMAAQQNDRKRIDRFKAISDIGSHIKSVTGDSSLRFHHLRHSFATRLYSYYLAQKTDMNLSNIGIANSSVITERWQDFVGWHKCQYPLRSIATAIGHRSEITTLEYYIHSVDEACQNIIDINDYKISNRTYAYALNIKINTVKQRIARKQICIIHKKIPTPQIKLVKRSVPKKFNKPDTGKYKPLSMLETDLLLSKFSETKQSIQKLVHQLILDQEKVLRTLKIAADLECESGFEFYQAISAHSAYSAYVDNLISPKLYFSHKIKYFKKENEHVTATLKVIEQHLQQLNQTEIKKLKEGLKIWRKTLKVNNNMNIITNKSELSVLTNGLQLIPIELYFTKISSTGIQIEIGSGKSYPDLRFTPLPLSQEKIKNRNKNRIGVSIKSGGSIKTNQSLNRIFTIVSIYVDNIK